MTPKEKAQQLVDKYDSILRAKFEMWGIAFGKSKPKECALIAVDEIIEAIHDEDFNGHVIDQIGASDYWMQVKQEIEEL